VHSCSCQYRYALPQHLEGLARLLPCHLHGAKLRSSSWTRGRSRSAAERSPCSIAVRAGVTSLIKVPRGVSVANSTRGALVDRSVSLAVTRQAESRGMTTSTAPETCPGSSAVTWYIPGNAPTISKVPSAATSAEPRAACSGRARLPEAPEDAFPPPVTLGGWSVAAAPSKVPRIPGVTADPRFVVGSW
jgi:hypothetical protein